MAVPRLSDLPDLSMIQTLQPTQPNQSDDLILITHNYKQNLQIIVHDLKAKIVSLNHKLTKHELKEAILDKIITSTYVELENLKENEFTRKGQKQSILVKQLEALSILHDTILKYEDTIQKYHKILIDVENSKFNSLFRVEALKKEEKNADENIAEILMTLQKNLSDAKSGDGLNSLLCEVQQELKDNNY
jgi:hypothetical protein